MKKPKPTKSPRKRHSLTLNLPKNLGGASDNEQLASLKKHIGLYAVGDTAAKVMILAYYINYSQLFERELHRRFDQDPTIQKKLKVDFDNNIMAYVRWVTSPGNQIPVHANCKIRNSGPSELVKAVGICTEGLTAAKAIILSYYCSYSQMLQCFIDQQFESDAVIQETLKKVHKNDLYLYLNSLYPQN